MYDRAERQSSPIESMVVCVRFSLNQYMKGVVKCSLAFTKCSPPFTKYSLELDYADMSPVLGLVCDCAL
jgi:hypothetical protein